MAVHRLWVSAALAALLLVGLSADGERFPALRPYREWHPPDGPGIDILATLQAPLTGIAFKDLYVTKTSNGARATLIANGETYWEHRRTFTDAPPPDLAALGEDRVGVVWRDGRVFAIDVRTGRVAWQTRLPDISAGDEQGDDRYNFDFWDVQEAGGRTTPVLAVRYYDRLQVIDGRTGRLLWHIYSHRCDSQMRIAGLSEAIAVNDCERGSARDIGDGHPLWRMRPLGRVPPEIRDLGAGRALGREMLTARNGLIRPWLTVRRMRDGRLISRLGLPALGTDSLLGAPPNGQAPQPPDRSDVAIIGGLRGVIAYRISDGRVAWRYMTPKERLLPDTLNALPTDGRVAYLMTDPGTLVQLDARTGRELDRHRFPITHSFEPSIAGFRNGVLTIQTFRRIHLVG